LRNKILKVTKQTKFLRLLTHCSSYLRCFTENEFCNFSAFEIRHRFLKSQSAKRHFKMGKPCETGNKAYYYLFLNDTAVSTPAETIC